MDTLNTFFMIALVFIIFVVVLFGGVAVAKGCAVVRIEEVGSSKV